MTKLLARVEPHITRTIKSLERKTFDEDPIAGPYSFAVSLFGSAYKRHGTIIEKALVEHLQARRGLKVWAEPQFKVSSAADSLATCYQDASSLPDAHLPYGELVRTLQLDLIVFDNATGVVSAYEVKRGAGTHDSGKRRQMARDTVCTKVLLLNYAKDLGLAATDSRAHIIFYYGKMSVPPPIGLRGEDLDELFGAGTYAGLETVNTEFRRQLMDVVERHSPKITSALNGRSPATLGSTPKDVISTQLKSSRGFRLTNLLTPFFRGNH